MRRTLTLALATLAVVSLVRPAAAYTPEELLKIATYNGMLAGASIVCKRPDDA